MCGIFAILHDRSQTNTPFIQEQFLKGQHRGPDSTKLQLNNKALTLGFHRLAINGLDDISNQPIIHNGISLICNGEIYNYKELYELMKDVTPVTHSDCEVIIHLYIKYGIEQTLRMLDGVFAFVLHDYRPSQYTSLLHIARDPLGVRPLYSLYCPNFNDIRNMDTFASELICFASELKCLEAFQELHSGLKVDHFTPSTYSTYAQRNSCVYEWKALIVNKPYAMLSFPHGFDSFGLGEGDKVYTNIRDYLVRAVHKRCETTDRPVACLLSGGLDSSLIAALVSNYFNRTGLRIETFSIGLADSEDLKFARKVATYINSLHTEIILTEDEMVDSIPDVIKDIESYDTTSIRASIGNHWLGKHIAQHSDAKVIFNGDGADELFGGYLYMNKCPDDIEFDMETRRLLKDIHLFDVLRSDKCISSHGLEPRTPFLDRSLVNYVLSIDPSIRNHTNDKDGDSMEKRLLRKAFSPEYFRDICGRPLLPDEILYRRKEAFSDGVSSHGRSLYTIIQEKIAYKLHVAEDYSANADIETEKKYYKQIFDKLYPNCDHIVPYFWMPKYTNATDPSARTLDIYVK